MKPKNDIAPARVREVLEYLPSSGVFRWRKTLSNRAMAGDEAGTIRKDKRRIIAVDGRDYLAARLAWVWMTGDWTQLDIDHIDMDRSNDQWANLRIATRSQNLYNRKQRSDAATPFKGIFKRKNGRYGARIGVAHLGTFDTPEEASAAYEAAAREAYGEFARAS